MWSRAKQILDEIECGHYSDPPGTEFYSYIVNDDGSIKTDKYGIKLLRSSRGTNSVENTHRQYSTTFRFRAGIEMADCLLGERRHRQNQGIACERFESYPDVGHFDTWLIDRLQNLLEHNHGKQLYDDWISASDFIKTPESFNMVALHNEELATALKNVKLKEGVTPLYTDDMKYLCKAMGTDVPFLPVHGKKEYKLFARLVLYSDNNTFDEQAMALKWMEFVDGVEVFPKLPAHLRMHLQRYDHNRRVRRATREMKTMVEQLRRRSSTMRHSIPTIIIQMIIGLRSLIMLMNPVLQWRALHKSAIVSTRTGHRLWIQDWFRPRLRLLLRHLQPLLLGRS